DAAWIEYPRRRDDRRLLVGGGSEKDYGNRRILRQHGRERAHAKRNRRAGPQLERQGELSMAVERHPPHEPAAHALVVADDDELFQMPAMLRGADAADVRLVPIIDSLPVFPGPALLGFVLIAVVVGQCSECRQMLRAVVRQPAQRVLAVECASRHAEISGTNTADAQIKARLRLVAG